MANLVYKLFRYNSIYVRTNGVWSDIGAPAPVVSNSWASQGAIGVAPDGTIFMVYNDGGASPGGWLWEHTTGTTWNELTSGPGRQAIARGAEFFPISKDEIWFVGDNTGGAHAVHWTRGGGFTNEGFPGYSPGSGNSVGSCIKLPNGDVLISIRSQGPSRCRVWRRPSAGPPWVLELDASVGSGGAGQAIFSPDGVNVWVSSDNNDLYHSTDSGLNWTGPLSVTGGGDYVTAITGDSASNVYFFYNNGNIVRYNGSTYAAVTSLAGVHSSAAWSDGKPITDVGPNAHVLFELNGSWVADGPGISVFNDFGAYVTLAAAVSDDEAPRVQGQDPNRHEGAVNPSTKINLSVIDDAGNLDDASVVLTVNGVIAWSSDAQQNSFVVSKVAVTNGNRYEITPPANLPDGATEVRVEADDGTNTLDEVYHFFVNRVGLLDDHFGGLGVNVLPGNGTISVVNGRLRIAATAGQNMNWWTSGRPGTIGVVPITNMMKGRHGVVYFETEMYSWTTTDSGASHTMWGLYLNDQNWYMVYTHDGTNWSAYKTIGNSWQFIGNYASNPTGPLPRRIRFKWDRLNKTIAWQINDSGWQDVVSPQTIEFTPTQVMFGLKNYGGLPACSTEYEELLIYAEDQVYLGSEDGSEVAQLHDVAEFNPQEDAAKRGGERYFVGPAKYNAEFGVGVELPGPPQQQVGSVGPFDAKAYSDQEEHPELVEGRHRGGIASVGLNLGGLIDRQRLGFLRAGLQDEEDTLLGIAGTYNDLTVDGDFNAHFTEKRIKGAFFYNTAGEDWANPVASGLTGYARDGTRYTAGVQDGGPVNAPWAAEAFSTTRGNRDDFPEEALIVWTDNTVVIFDLTNFPADLTMWMRFTVDAANILRVTVTDVKMVNGAMIVSHTTGTSGLILVDFKGDTTANVGHLIRPDNHWRWNGDIVARNGGSLWTTSGVSPSLRINSENNYNLAARKEGSKYYVGISGEDDTHVIEVDDSQGSVPNRSFATTETDRPANIGDIRNVTFDDFGWLWTSEQKILVRNATQWRDGPRMLETRERPAARGVSDFFPVVQLPYDINHLVSARDYVYCGTDVGIYRVKRGTLKVELAYTIVGGGGGGRLNNPPDGEILLGDTPQILWLHAYSLDGSSYLAVATYQGVVTIRLYDDVITQGLVYPALYEHRAYFNTSAVS